MVNQEVELENIQESLVNLKLKESNDCLINEHINQLLPQELSSDGSDDETETSSYDDEDEENEENENETTTNDDDMTSKNSSDKETKVDDESTAYAVNLRGLTTDNGTINSDTKNSSSRKYDFKGRPAACVFVASLASTLTDDELCISVTKKFKRYGELNGVKVLRDQQNRPYAFVQYTNLQDAQLALSAAHGSRLDGRIIRCEAAKVNRTLFISSESNKLFIDVENFCNKFGELEQIVPGTHDIKDVSVIQHKFPDVEAKSWFIQFAYRDDAIRAFANIKTELNWNVQWAQNVKVPENFNLLNYDKINGKIKSFIESPLSSGSTSKVVDISSFKIPNSTEPSKISIDKRSIFIGQLHDDTNSENLAEHFGVYGKILDCKVIHKPNNVFAFIEFDDEMAAAAALEKENHSIFLNKTIHVQYKEININNVYVRRDKRHDGFSHSSNSTSLNIDLNKDKINDSINTSYMGPQLNLAPPPINIYRRRSHDGAVPTFTPNYIPPAMAFQNYMGGTRTYRHNSCPNPNWALPQPLPSHLPPPPNLLQHSTFHEVDENEHEEYYSDKMDEDEDAQRDTEEGKKSDSDQEGDEDDSDIQNEDSEYDNMEMSYVTSGPSMTNYNMSSAGSNIKSKYTQPSNSYYYPPQFYYSPMPYQMAPPPPPPHLSQTDGHQPYYMYYPMPPNPMSRNQPIVPPNQQITHDRNVPMNPHHQDPGFSITPNNFAPINNNNTTNSNNNASIPRNFAPMVSPSGTKGRIYSFKSQSFKPMKNTLTSTDKCKETEALDY